MEKLNYVFETTEPIDKKVHIGVVASGDLEVIFKPIEGKKTTISITTGSDGFEKVWENVLKRFLKRYPITADIVINDFGATPGVVSLRLTQALEALNHDE